MLYSLKNFSITFLLSVVLFAVIAYFVTNFITNTMTPVLDPDDGLSEILGNGTSDSTDTPETDEWGDPINQETSYDPTDPSLPTYIDVSEIKSESFNVLLVGTDYRPDFYTDYLPSKFDSNDYGYGVMSQKFRTVKADTIILVRVDKERRQFTFTSFPSNMRLFVGTNYTTLGDLYTDYGIDYLTSKVTAITGITVDYYAVLNISDMSSVMSEIGSVTMEFPYNIYLYNGQYITNGEGISGATLALKSGTTEINSSNVNALLQFNQYPNGIAERMRVFVEFSQKLLAEITKPENIGKINQIYSALEPSLTTNMTLTDIMNHLDLITYYDKFEHVDITYPGSYFKMEEEVYFNPDINEGLKTFLDYRRVTEPEKVPESESTQTTDTNSETAQ